jgi:hypothetical protein
VGEALITLTLATIHQPRSDIWKLADNVTLLAKGGLVAFSGKQTDAIPYFSSIGYPMPSAFFNPADHLLDIVSVDPRAATHESSAERVKRMTNLWGVETGEESSCEYAAIRSGSLTTPMRIALPLVISRHFKNLFRQTPVFINRFMQAPFVGALFILFFQRLTHGPQGKYRTELRSQQAHRTASVLLSSRRRPSRLSAS